MAGLAYSGNGVRNINKVKLRRARLALGLVTTFGGLTILVFIQATQPGHSSVGRCNEYSSLGSKWRLSSYDIIALYKSVYKYKYKLN